MNDTTRDDDDLEGVNEPTDKDFDDEKESKHHKARHIPDGANAGPGIEGVEAPPSGSGEVEHGRRGHQS